MDLACERKVLTETLYVIRLCFVKQQVTLSLTGARRGHNLPVCSTTETHPRARAT
jgi:hypothetical protein